MDLTTPGLRRSGVTQKRNQVGLGSGFFPNLMPTFEGAIHEVDETEHFDACPRGCIIVIGPLPLLLSVKERVGHVMQMLGAFQFLTWTGIRS